MIAFAAATLALAGCGGGGDQEADVAAQLQERLGADAEVRSCIDQRFEDDGLHLYECVVHPGGGPDTERWNAVVDDDGELVDASRQ